jgi:hypothetical protein
MARTDPAPHRFRLSPAALIALASLPVAACLGGVNRVYDDGGTGAPTDGSVAPETASGSADGSGDDGTSIDATNDVASDMSTGGETAAPETGPPVEAGPETGTGQTYLCNGAQVASCASCTSGTLDCVFCGQAGTHPGFCGTKGQYCQNSAPPQTGPCTCGGGNVAACPAASQVCTFITNQFYCQSCGEMGSGTHACKGGGTCNEQTGTCS